MKKIYVVTAGCYSDYGISAVFSTKEKAEKFIKIFPTYFYDEHEIEEYALDPDFPEAKSGREPFLVQIKKDGRCMRDAQKAKFSPAFVNEPISFGHDKSFMNVYCFADDEEHAIKIANEKRGEWIAMNKWPE